MITFEVPFTLTICKDFAKSHPEETKEIMLLAAKRELLKTIEKGEGHTQIDLADFPELA